MQELGWLALAVGAGLIAAGAAILGFWKRAPRWLAAPVFAGAAGLAGLGGWQSIISLRDGAGGGRPNCQAVVPMAQDELAAVQLLIQRGKANERTVLEFGCLIAGVQAEGTDADARAAAASAAVSFAKSPDARVRAAVVKVRDPASRADALDALWALASSAEQLAEVGALAFGLDTARALRAYEKAFALAAEDFWTAIFLARLRKEAGNLAGARQAALAAQSAARGDREISVAANDLGDLLVKAGDVNEAKARFGASLAIRERLARENPGSAQAQRDVSVSLIKLGDVAVEAGDVNEAKARFGASLAIRERLARDNPGSAQAQRDLSVSLSKLGDVAVKAGDLNEAKARFGASLAIAERLARDNPGSAEAQRDLAVSYERLGSVAIQAGDLNSAKAWFEKELVISKQRMDQDAASAEAKRFHSVVLNKLGDVAVLAGDVNEAKARFVASHAILERLARDNPGSAQAQRDVWTSQWRMANLGLTPWSDVVRAIEAMERAGTLAPPDRQFLEAARAKAAADR